VLLITFQRGLGGMKHVLHALRALVGFLRVQRRLRHARRAAFDLLGERMRVSTSWASRFASGCAAAEPGLMTLIGSDGEPLSLSINPVCLRQLLAFGFVAHRWFAGVRFVRSTTNFFPLSSVTSKRVYWMFSATVNARTASKTVLD